MPDTGAVVQKIQDDPGDLQCQNVENAKKKDTDFIVIE